MIDRPAWLRRLERRIGRKLAIHPHWLSAAKLVVVTPALLWSLQSGQGPGVALILFAAFGMLDYLDGVVARERGLATGFGRVFDRVTDYPLLVGISMTCAEVVPMMQVSIKIAIDLLLLVLFALGRGSTQNRLRTALSYATLLALLVYSQSWAPALVTTSTIVALLVANIGLSLMVVLYNLDLLRKRHVANLLSCGNLACGVAGIACAAVGHPFGTLLAMLLGLLFDGFDGVAARRWGSTRWGVYSDDVADGVSFALAPGAVLLFSVGGAVGAALGGLYALSTIGRLVYFTLDAKNADPRYFSGAPSPVGGLIAICAAILFPAQPAVIGFLVGVACVQMVSFATAYRHLGRLIARYPRALLALPGVGAVLALAWVPFGFAGPVAILLCGALGYAVWPTVRAFGRVAIQD